MSQARKILAFDLRYLVNKTMERNMPCRAPNIKIILKISMVRFMIENTVGDHFYQHKKKN